MNLRNLFRVSGVLYLLFGASWLLAPKTMLAAYGVNFDSYSAHLLQQLGAVNVAAALLCFLVSGMNPSPARQAVVTFFFAAQLLATIVNLINVLNGSVPAALGWSGVAFNLIFTLAFGYFRFIRPEENVTPGLKS